MFLSLWLGKSFYLVFIISYMEAEKVRKMVYEAIAKISNAIGESIPFQEFPSVVLQDRGKSSYHGVKNIITISEDYEGDRNGFFEAIGEEAGHFVRNYLVDKFGLPNDTKTVGEFFGISFFINLSYLSNFWFVIKYQRKIFFYHSRKFIFYFF